MSASTHTHEELATKADVDARFDRIDERLRNIDCALANLATSLSSTMTRLEEILAKIEENQRTMIQILLRIENNTNRQIGF